MSLGETQGLDLGVPNKLLGFFFTVAHNSVTIDPHAHAESVVVEGRGSSVENLNLPRPGCGPFRVDRGWTEASVTLSSSEPNGWTAIA